MACGPVLVASGPRYFDRGLRPASQIAATEADERLLGRSAVGYDPAQRDDRAMALDQLVEAAVDHADGVVERRRAGLELAPGIRQEAVGPLERALAGEFLDQGVGALGHVVDGEVAGLPHRAQRRGGESDRHHHHGRAGGQMRGRQRQEAGRSVGALGGHDGNADRPAADRLPEGLCVDLAIHAVAPLLSDQHKRKECRAAVRECRDSFPEKATVRHNNGGDEDLASLTLFHGWRSSASRRVRLCLAEKGLAFDSKVIDLVKGEHHLPEFLRLNPNGVIPLLILEDGRALYESGTICEYVDETWPEPPLRPADAYGRAEMRNWIRHVDGLIGNLIIFNWVHGMAQVAQKWTDAELAERLAGARPLFDGGHRGRAVRQTPRRGDRPRRDDPRAPSQSLGLVGGD